jgi:voltage-gated potassium channel
VVTFLDSMLRDRDKNLRIEEITVGPGSPAIGKRVGDLQINQSPGLLLLALVAPGGRERNFKPADGLVVEQGAVLLVMGSPDAVNTLRQRHGGHDYAELKTTTETPIARRS